MGLRIATTGLEQYAPGGNARVKVLIIGGPGVGKTRSASYWPKPIFADCEGGLASVADRTVPFVTINSSQNMLDFLDFLKLECRRPEQDRRFKTVVIDTLDTFQRKVKDEWLQAHPSSGSFSGYDAWGYLDAKMQMLMTRLLNLDMNVYVAVHYSEKTVGEDDKAHKVYQLQLAGAIKDQVFNDFDLVGWMGVYYVAEGGERVEKRGLTFKATPDKPFLKDRLFATPPWLDITFSDDDYANLWIGLTARLDAMGESQDLGEVPSTGSELVAGEVVSPEGVGGSTLPPVDPKSVPLAQFDKPTLARMAKDEGVTQTVTGEAIKSNTLKGELVAAIEKHREQVLAATTADIQTPQVTSDASTTVEDAAPDNAAAETVVTAVSGGETVKVDTATGEVKATVETTHDAAVETAKETLGATVESDTVSQPETPAVQPTLPPAPPAVGSPTASGVCETCGTDLANEKPDFVKLSFIKYRKRLCEADYKAMKKG